MPHIPEHIARRLQDRGCRAEKDEQGYVHFMGYSKSGKQWNSLGRMVNPDGTPRSPSDQDLTLLDKSGKDDYGKEIVKAFRKKKAAEKRDDHNFSEQWARDWADAHLFALKDGVHGREHFIPDRTETGANGRRLVMAFDHYGNRIV